MEIKRIPIYILLDIGRNMWGKPIERAAQIIQAVFEEAKMNPDSIEHNCYCFITIGRQIEVSFPLTRLLELPSIKISLEDSVADTTSINQYMADIFNRDVRAQSLDCKGDYPPRVLWFSDGTHVSFEDNRTVRNQLWRRKGMPIYFLVIDCASDDHSETAEHLARVTSMGQIWRDEDGYVRWDDDDDRETVDDSVPQLFYH